MEIRLWGMVTVVSDGREVQPASGRAKHLLACLAWQPRELVLDEHLIDRIWGGELCADPRDALYTCAKRLRRALATGGADPRVLIRRRGGYLLDTEPGQVDLNRFRHLVHEARKASDDPTAALLYGQALKLPRGTPLADIDSPWAERIRHALLQEHLSAQLAASTAWLRSGRHRELIPELAHLAAQHPLEEAVSGLLMVALHRSGQQAEALEQFARIRSRLISELGVEPGPTLRRTHRRLLCGVGAEQESAQPRV